MLLTDTFNGALFKAYYKIHVLCFRMWEMPLHLWENTLRRFGSRDMHGIPDLGKTSTWLFSTFLSLCYGVKSSHNWGTRNCRYFVTILLCYIKRFSYTLYNTMQQLLKVLWFPNTFPQNYSRRWRKRWQHLKRFALYMYFGAFIQQQRTSSFI